jgi:two-component system cell cycle response regulator
MEQLEFRLSREEDLSLMLIDMDSLKQVNDAAGHVAGDALLKAAAASLASGVRRSDIVGRYGGDEFVVLMPQTSYDEAVAIAARLAAAMDNLPVTQPRGVTGAHAASFGISTSQADGTTPEALLEAADLRMYAMKRIRREHQDD